MRFWLVLAGLIVLGAVVLSLTASKPGRSLDPDSASHPGSLALARLLQQQGTVVHRRTSLADIPAGATVVLAFPDSYSAEQLGALAGSGRRLIIPTSNFALRTLAPDLALGDADTEPHTVDPGCSDPGARAVGPVQFPARTPVITGAGCYGGRVNITPGLVVIGPSSLFTNARLADQGVAALDLNAITDNGTVRQVTWLLPGADAQGSGSPSVWQLLPDWTPRAFGWIIVLGLLLVSWRSRRLGPVVYEPLPVVVRAAEIVEGHGRLYRRARARESAATALRQASRRRLARTHHLPVGHTVPELVAVLSGQLGRPPAEQLGRTPAELQSLIDGPVPLTDAELIELGVELGALEALGARPAAIDDHAILNQGDGQ